MVSTRFGVGKVSIGLSGLAVGTSEVTISGSDGANSGEGLGVFSLATGVVGTATDSVASSPFCSSCVLFFLIMNLQIQPEACQCSFYKAIH